MGCFQSSMVNPPPYKRPLNPKKPYAAARNNNGMASPAPVDGAVPPFSQFSFSDLKSATNKFSSDFIVAGSGDKALNVVYKGRLHNQRLIAVKKFSKLAWPDSKQFSVFSNLFRLQRRKQRKLASLDPRGLPI